MEGEVRKGMFRMPQVSSLHKKMKEAESPTEAESGLGKVVSRVPELLGKV